jgi:hypothetical protein
VVNVRADKSEKSEKSQKSAKSKDEERAQDEVRNGSMPVSEAIEPLLTIVTCAPPKDSDL